MGGSSASVLVARLELASVSVKPGGMLGYTVVNAGVLPIMLGEGYKLQQRVIDRWELLALPYGFRAIGYRLEPGGRRELSVRIPESAQPGRYRVCKRLIADPGHEPAVVGEVDPIELTASFDVAL